MLQQPNCHKRGCRHFAGVTDGPEVSAGPAGTLQVQRPCCTAYPDGIPAEIAYGPNLHLTPFPGDRGIVYYNPDDPANPPARKVGGLAGMTDDELIRHAAGLLVGRAAGAE